MIKRIFDVTASFLGLLVLLFPFICIGVAIAATSRGGVFFKQVRVGLNGKTFRILKFRTMVADAGKGRHVTVRNDARITPIGRILRKTKVDELPQLFNVLIGQMSFVGPRPEVPQYVALYTDQQRGVLSVKPGITDIASIEFSNENELLSESDNPEGKYISEVMPIKLDLNLKYLEKRNFCYDITIILKTVTKLLMHRKSKK
ncbi:MAG: sugar transferase [Christensenellaceae bacterium]|nr:sugar transferase [Christensenellaceae bacterium]